ncbi:MAG: hypothetical protein SH817_08420 [Leptospira sp.]|nr:hypothetical protein [Leptospira sp.]
MKKRIKRLLNHIRDLRAEMSEMRKIHKMKMQLLNEVQFVLVDLWRENDSLKKELNQIQMKEAA